MLLAVCEAKGLDYGSIPRIASGLGGGIGRQGEVCGALTGGVMAIGLIHGPECPDDKETKNATYTKAGEFARRFGEVNGTVRCRDLIDLDLSSYEGVQEYYERNLYEEVCFGVVRNASRAIFELLDEWEVPSQ